MKGQHEDCCNPDAMIDADPMRCMVCGEPLLTWEQEVWRYTTHSDGTRSRNIDYLIQIHCDNRDCALYAKTSDPDYYHEHMALFLNEIEDTSHA